MGIQLPALNLILQSMETVEGRNPALSHSFEVTRDYQVFRADDKQPTSEVTAQVSFIPPDVLEIQNYAVEWKPQGSQDRGRDSRQEDRVCRCKHAQPR